MLGGWMVQSAVEEAFFRGWLMDRLTSVGKKVSIWASSVTFALLHGTNPHITWLALVNISFFAVLMALHVQRSGHVWGAAGLHAGWNFAQGTLFTMHVSGMEAFSPSSILSLTITGPAWLTGGSFGVEGSIIFTVILCGCIAYYFYGWPSPAVTPAGKIPGRSV